MLRSGTGKAAYQEIADSTCNLVPPPPTATPTNTKEPKPTKTPTEGPSPTPTQTKTPGAKKNRIDDANPRINYQPDWTRLTGSPSCVYRNGFHVSGAGRKNIASFAFTADHVKVWYIQQDVLGQAEVRIDGNLQTTINMQGDATARCKSWLSEPLSAGEHIIEIRPAVGSTGGVTLDAFTLYQ